jgi:tetratricopeptide (TPR) repeat protein
VREVNGRLAVRRTGKPSTADLAVRLRCTRIAQSSGGSGAEGYRRRVPDLPDLAALGTFDERLREVARDAAAVEAALAAGRRALAEADDPQAELALRGYVGNALRLLGRHGEAAAAQARAVELAEEVGPPRASVAARIRLGEALRCGDRLDEAESQLRAALAAARARPELGLTDFALQHLGKTLLDAGRPAEAEALLAEALVLREAKRDPALVRSTRAALELARRAS